VSLEGRRRHERRSGVASCIGRRVDPGIGGGIILGVGAAVGPSHVHPGVDRELTAGAAARGDDGRTGRSTASRRATAATSTHSTRPRTNLAAAAVPIRKAAITRARERSDGQGAHQRKSADRHVSAFICNCRTNR
jgi:hypothetical protein